MHCLPTTRSGARPSSSSSAPPPHHHQRVRLLVKGNVLHPSRRNGPDNIAAAAAVGTGGAPSSSAATTTPGGDGGAAAATAAAAAAAGAAAKMGGNDPPFVLGLTGSIGMGKSTVSAMFAARGVPVVDADALVHRLYAKGGAAVAAVGAAFPSAVVDGAVSRPALGAAVVGDEAAMKRLEAIVHPLVEAARVKEMRAAADAGAPLIVLDIPLLYETGGEAACDAVAVVSAPAAAQRARVLARPGMAPEKFEAILARQVPDAEKRRRADYVIDTGAPLADTDAAVGVLVAELGAAASAGRRAAFARALLAGETTRGGRGPAS